MKKNKMMRAASALMVATLLTTSVISGTFAKYTTKAVGGDYARVATWGFTQTTIELDNLFKKAYGTTVGSATDVIAPGTKGKDTFSFTYAGQEDAPEVAYKFEVSTYGSGCTDDIKNNPNILWKLDDCAFGTWDKLLADIKALSGDSSGTKVYNPGELPTAFNQKGANNHTVEWKWAFVTQDDPGTAENEMTNQDTKDTAMGNKYPLESVSLVITITATQID